MKPAAAKAFTSNTIMQQRYFLAFSLLYLAGFCPLFGQDTLSFGGIYELPGAEVRATYTPVSPLAQSFTIEEVYRLPGTFYDPARLVALLPGVVQTNDQANHLSVRGNTPNANLWRLNGLAIVNPNHTANAGTFYDFPTLSGGGVNAISAQMLDNSGFLAGGLPVEYGFATGGTFDLRLRPGSKTKQKYQAQAGFIGFDLMAEGPIGSSGQTSYLVNGRYSFTGLLADMGVDFGGEEIRFADLNAHLHHEWDGGEVSVFSIVGASSNIYAGPDSTEQEITEQKELFDIDFESDVQIYGATFQNHPRGRNSFSAGVSFSETNSDRSQSSALWGNEIAFYNLGTNQVNAFFKWRRKIRDYGKVRFGVEYLAQRLTLNSSLDNRSGTYRGNQNALAPFAEYNFDNKQWQLSAGLRYSVYDSDYQNGGYFEPRLQVGHRWSSQSIRFVAETRSQTLLAVDALYGIDAFDLKKAAIINHQFSLVYARKIAGLTVNTTAFYQITPEDFGDNNNIEGFINSRNNSFELVPDFSNPVFVATRRYGLELEAGGGDKNLGWYYRGSLTLFRAETQQADGNWTKDRFSSDFIGKLTIGREWQRLDKKERSTIKGLNLSLITHGGERYGIVRNLEGLNGGSQYFTPQIYSQGYINSTGTYFRPDLRLYKTKTRTKTTTTLALDLQNVAGIENVGNVYYDAYLERPNERLQLGLIPVLSYRVVWR